jgi:hypothetical protein
MYSFQRLPGSRDSWDALQSVDFERGCVEPLEDLCCEVAGFRF